MKQICQKLKERGEAVPYSTVYQWMKRAVAREEFTKRGVKYRIKENAIDA